MIEKEKYFVFEDLVKEDVYHLFTKKPFNFDPNEVSEEEIQKEYQEIESLLGCSFPKICQPLQTHTNIVKKVDENTVLPLENVDGLVTNLKGVALVTRLADCQGILLYDPKKKVIGNIHSGWKGTLGRIIKKAVLLMEEEYGCESQDIKAYICPSIQKCCFEVEEDVMRAFKKEFKDLLVEENITKGKPKEGRDKYYIDLVALNQKVLQKIGLLPSHIFVSHICTKCEHEKIFSYRAEGHGRNTAWIALK